MSKHPQLRLSPAAVKIRRAAQASRLMTVPERLQIMVKAGLLTTEQAKKVSKPQFSGKPE